jgi:putative transposase
MSNHMHLLAVPRTGRSLAQTMRRLQSEYALRLNRRQGCRTGHLWQSRFHSCPVDGQAIWTVLRYIERNPVHAGLVERAEHSGWSSAPVHCGLRTAPAMLSLKAWAGLWTAPRWQSVLAYGEDERQIAAIREATSRGRPLGDDAFLAELERHAGRRLTARPNGRPRQCETPLIAATSAAGGTLPD